MTRACCIEGCDQVFSNAKKNTKTRAFFEVPSTNSKRRQDWLDAISPYTRKTKGDKHLYVCELHFQSQDLEPRFKKLDLSDESMSSVDKQRMHLKLNSVPSIFQPSVWTCGVCGKKNTYEMIGSDPCIGPRGIKNVMRYNPANIFYPCSDDGKRVQIRDSNSSKIVEVTWDIWYPVLQKTYETTSSNELPQDEQKPLKKIKLSDVFLNCNDSLLTETSIDESTNLILIDENEKNLLETNESIITDQNTIIIDEQNIIIDEKQKNGIISSKKIKTSPPSSPAHQILEQLEDSGLSDEELIIMPKDVDKIPENDKTPENLKDLKLLNERKVNELLITEVRKREPLWNHKLPISKRSNDKKFRLWKEVAKVDGLNDKFSSTTAAQKFKNLVDTYRKIIQNEYVFGIDGKRSPQKTKWVYYDMMEFVRDRCLATSRDKYILQENEQRKQNCSEDQMMEEGEENNDGTQEGFFMIDGKAFNNSNNLEIDDCNSSTLLEIAKKLTKDVELPQMPRQDDVDYALGLVATYCRKLNYNVRQKFLHKIISESFDLTQKHLN